MLKVYLIPILFLFGIVTNGIGQDIIKTTQIGLDTAKHNNILTIKSHAGYSSNNLNAHFINACLLSKNLSENLRQNTENRLREKNILFADINFKMRYSHISDDSIPTTTYIEFSHQKLFGARFHKNVFHLLFFGNKDFAGKTVNISPTRLSYLNYNKMTLGTIYHSKNHTLSVGFGVIQSDNYFSLKTDNATLSTHPEGNSLDITHSSHVIFSDSSTHGNYTMNGIGFCFDFSISKQLANNSKLDLTINNIGFISYNSKTYHYKNTNTIHFEGLVLNDLQNLSADNYLNSKIDSTIEAYTNGHFFDNHITVAPIETVISYQKPVFNNKIFHIGAFYTYFTGNLPAIFLAITFKTEKIGFISPMANFSTNILNSLRIGAVSPMSFIIGNRYLSLGCNWQIPLFKSGNLTIQTKYINGFILSKYHGSQSIFINYNYYF